MGQLFRVGFEFGQADVEVRADCDLGELGLHHAGDPCQQFMDVGSAIAGQTMRSEQAVDQRLQPVRLADDHLGVFDEGRAIELAFEQLRGPADAAQRVLDLVRETPNQLPVRLLLLEQTLLAGDLELLVDVPKFEQQGRVTRLDHRDGAGQVQARLAVDAELELLLGVRRAAGERFVDRLKQRGRLAEDRPGRVAEQLAPRQLEQVLRCRIGIGNLEGLGEHEDGRREQFQSGVGSRVIVGSHR